MRSVRFTVCLFFSFVLLNAAAAGKPKFENKVCIFQNNAEQAIEQDAVVSISRAAFSIRFFNKAYDAENKKYHSIMLAVFSEKLDLDALQTGMKKSETSCFFDGSGMAPARTGFYGHLIVNKEACHYLYYASETDKRVNLVSEKAEMLYLDFPVLGIDVDGEELSFDKFQATEFYVAVLNDFNLNEKMDAGELVRFTVRFK